MATEGKHSPFSIKTMVLSGGGFLVAWGATKLLDTYFDTTLLQDAKGWLLRAWSWLLLDTPMPNWSLLMIIVVLISTLSVAIYYYRTTDGAYGDLHEAELAVYKMNNPQSPQLTDVQTHLVEALAFHANYAKTATVESVCKFSSLGKLQAEAGLEQLEAKGLVKRKVFRGTFATTTFELTLAGKEYALEQLELT
ncbi:hypothetical protein [Pseudomonas sp. YL-218 TE3947]|jgi:hypothetical protein|uniref:hypothetical protein n=1 Tax=Pseudomonas TaxID=286 RepID=UPI003D2279A7